MPALVLALLAAAQTAGAQDGTPVDVTDDEVNQVAKQLYCPVCENVPLDVCPTLACIQWRATIREKLEASWSEQQILDYFALQYGERTLARPSARGVNVLIWIAPPLLVTVGSLALWRYLRHATLNAGPRAARGPADDPAAAKDGEPTDEYVERLERELRRRK
jgi:cytochrome c-type biogenesis protein CcmH